VAFESLRWGLIGASDIAESRMIGAMHRVGDEVMAIYSGSVGRATGFASRNGIPGVCETLDELLGDTRIDAVYISSKNRMHAAQVEQASAAGKHILCEKPIATSLADARTMILAARAGRVVLAVNHHLPAAGTHRMIKELVTAGAIGRPLAVRVRHTNLLLERLRGWRLSGEAGAGVVMDLTGHDASAVNAILSRTAREVVALGVRQGSWISSSDDAAMAVVRYTDDILVQFHDAFTTPFAATSVDVYGAEGTIYAPNVMTPEPVGEVYLEDINGRREIRVSDRRHSYDVTLLAFRASIRGEDVPVVGGDEAFASLAVTVAILDAAATGTLRAVEAM
jgi:1,5-anhydro-D-fructose reductase (1,5-anhydro-D-mannitol-forming)